MHDMVLRADSFPCLLIVLIISFAGSGVIVFQQKVLKMSERQFGVMEFRGKRVQDSD